jgi:hypothetical protein
MRRMPPVMRSVMAVTILIVSPTWALAQAESPRLDDPDDPWWRNGGPRCISTLVRDAPFSAEAVTVWYPPANSGRTELRVTARYFRDHTGRVRVDYLDGPSRARVMVTPDADRGAVHFLDTAARTTTKWGPMTLAMSVGADCSYSLEIPLSMNRFIGFHAIPLDAEALGERLTQGVRVTGSRFKTKLPGSVIGMGLGERWVSPELKLVVYSRREDSHVGIVEYQLRKISRADPPAQLFEVPADYVEVAPAGCTVWENAYAPHIRGPECDRR